MAREKAITISGARLHNLKNFDVSIPHNKLTVVTGLSGSGKSTLAFDTLYAEGQRRFVESLSSYARQFLERMAKPDVDSITGLPPAIAIEQNSPSRNPRSTVGTSTEIYDYMRLLYGRAGHTICRCGREVRRDSPDSIVEALSDLPPGVKLYVLFPFNTDGKFNDELERIKQIGYFRAVARQSTEVMDFSEIDPARSDPSDYLVLADRIVLSNEQDNISRMTESIESALRAGGGKLIVRLIDNGSDMKFSSDYECPDCQIIYNEPEPKLFSFNNPFGACPNCQGFGRTVGIDEDLVVPDRTITLEMNPFHPFKGPAFSKYHRDMLKFAVKAKIPANVPYDELSAEQKNWLWEGKGSYAGVDGFFQMLEDKNYKLHYRVMLSKYRGYTTCKKCNSSRLRTSARRVFVAGKSIPDLISMPLSELLEHFNSISISSHEMEIVSEVLRELKSRTQMLVDIGLEYLNLARLTHTLSGGEAQRISLSSALGSSLVGTLYVLDEPSIGLHPRDTQRLLNILFKLRNLGNTVVVVEHDSDIIKSADHIIDIGPEAGEHGGNLVHSGDFESILSNEQSYTGKYLSGKLSVDLQSGNSPAGEGKYIKIYKPRKHNLKLDLVEFPLGCVIAVTGVSGSGKSTLIHDVLFAGIKKVQGGFEGRSSAYFEKITGVDYIDFVELVDQSSIGKSSRSTPITYTKAFDHIRELFANTQLARQMGVKPGYFSFNVSGGRCEVCDGEGYVNIDMQFLPDIKLLCEACNGTRYKKEAKSIKYRDKSVVDVLNMTVDEAAEFFKNVPKIQSKLQILQEVGLGYLHLGQPSTMLSGGESQRIKLSGHLEATKAKTLFIFDEPTTGLHIHDITKLIDCFRRLVSAGHSVVIIEHNLHVIASSDWIIDLGPEAGNHGGELVAQGAPQFVADNYNTHTAIALSEFYRHNKSK